MKITHPAVRLQDPDPIAGLAVAVGALHAQHPATGGFAGGFGGPVGIGELAGGRIVAIAAPIGPVSLGLHAGGSQQTCQHQQREAS